MHKNRLVIFALVAAVLIIAASLAVKKEDSSVSNSEAGKLMYPDLKSQVNDITQIELAQRDQVFHVVLSDKGWQIKEKYDYAADVSKIKQVVLGISDLTTIEPKTKKADRYAVLGVDDVKADSASSQIRLINKQGKELAGLIVGKQESTSLSGQGIDSVFVRRIGDAQSWLAKGEVHLDAKASQWLVSKLFDVGHKRIQKVILSSPENKSLTLEKNDRTAQDFTLLAIPKNKTIESSSEINAIADAVGNIVIRDVDSQSNENGPSFEKDVYHAKFIAFDGLEIDVDTVKLHGKHFAKFSARFDPSMRKEDAKAAKADDKAKPEDKEKGSAAPATPAHGMPPQPAPLQSADDTIKEAQDLNAKFKGWVFEISSTKADSMRKTMADLVKDKVEKAVKKAKKT